MSDNNVYNMRVFQNAMATPEEISEAKENGQPIEYREAKQFVKGYVYKGAIYITEVEAR